jgi:parallel beta-helix repeat protein
MKKLLTILILLICSISAYSTVYHVAATGGDYSTITQVNAATLAAGDQVLFNRGETFYGTLNPKAGSSGNPIVYGAYGSGANPIITGFTTVSGWTNEGSGIYSKVITTGLSVQVVTIDGVQYGMGRYPNSSYLTWESATTNISITDNSGFGASNWVGAEIVLRKNGYTIDRCTVTNQVSNTLTYTSLGTTRNANNTGNYFIQNSINVLDVYGEWFYNSSTGKLSVYFGSDPSAKVVKAATLDYCVNDPSFRDYVTLDGITFEGANINAIRFPSGNDYITVQNCTIRNVGGIAVWISQTNETFTGNTVTYCGGGIYTNGTGTTGASSSVVSSNTFSNIGTTEGQVYQIVDAIVIVNRADNTLIQYNSINNTAYSGIYAQNGKQAEIRNNYVTNTAQLIDDAGAIYLNGDQTGTIVDNNILTDSKGNGIYLDEKCDGATVTDNTAANCLLSGIKLNMAHNNTITGNTSYNNSNWQFSMENWEALWDGANENNLYNNTVTGNIFVAKESTQGVLIWVDDYDGTFNIGNFNNNYYCRPILETTIFTTNHATTTQRTFADWKTFTSQDANSAQSPKALTSTADLYFAYNATNATVLTSLPYTGIDVRSNRYASSTNISAWSSLVLFKDLTNTSGYNKQSKSNTGKPIKSYSGNPIYTR